MLGRINSLDSVENILQEFSTGAGSTKKEALQEMKRLWEQSIEKNNNRGFLIIYPYQQWGSGARIQIGGFDG
jgi:hypothetical protein